VPVFSPELPISVWGFTAANLISSVFIPSGYELIDKRDDILDV
jgi:hypothetical protein